MSSWLLSLACVLRRRAVARPPGARDGALDDLVAELHPDPAHQVLVDDVLDGDVAPDLAGQRRAESVALVSVSGRATRTVAITRFFCAAAWVM